MKKPTLRQTLSAELIDAEWREWNLPGADDAVAFLCLPHHQQLRKAFEDGLRRGATIGAQGARNDQQEKPHG